MVLCRRRQHSCQAGCTGWIQALLLPLGALRVPRTILAPRPRPSERLVLQLSSQATASWRADSDPSRALAQHSGPTPHSLCPAVTARPQWSPPQASIPGDPPQGLLAGPPPGFWSLPSSSIYSSSQVPQMLLPATGEQVPGPAGRMAFSRRHRGGTQHPGWHLHTCSHSVPWASAGLVAPGRQGQGSGYPRTEMLWL